MTDPLDELTELTPTHASALLLDPVDLAERAERSARRARRRSNGFMAGYTAVALALLVGVGSVFLQPMQTMIAGPTPSGVPSEGMQARGGRDPAGYSTPRVGVAVVVGGAAPDQLCLGDYTAGKCAVGVKLEGVTWGMVPWRETDGATSYARALVIGSFDGKTFTATKVQELSSFAAIGPLVASPKRLNSSALSITCEVTVNAAPGTGLDNEPLSFAGLEAYWADPHKNMYVVAISGDLGAAVTAVKKSVSGTVCIGGLPSTGTLADLVAAAKKLNTANMDGLVKAELSVDNDGAAIQVQVAANVPGLREKLVGVVGPSVPLAIDPVLLTVA